MKTLLILLLLATHSLVYAGNTELNTLAKVVDISYISSPKFDIKDDLEGRNNVELDIEIGGTPLMVVNFSLNSYNFKSNRTINKEYILDKNGQDRIQINYSTFFQNKIGKINIDY